MWVISNGCSVKGNGQMGKMVKKNFQEEEMVVKECRSKKEV